MGKVPVPMAISSKMENSTLEEKSKMGGGSCLRERVEGAATQRLLLHCRCSDLPLVFVHYKT